MAPHDSKDTVGQTRGPATPSEQREKAKFGKRFATLFLGFAAVMFLIYIAIVVYRVATAV